MDFTDFKNLRNVFSDIEPNIYLHHGGYAVNYSSSDFDEKTADQINVEPLNHIYSLAKEFNLEGVVLTGSSMEYGDSGEPHTEDEDCHPATAYGRSKLRMTKESQRLAERHSLPTRVARVFNPFGHF